MNHNILNKILIALAALIVIVYFYPHPEANRFNYEEGRPWNYTKLIAPFDIPIHPDSATLLAARDTLDARFVPIYQLNQLLIDTIISHLPASPGTHLDRRLGAELRKVYASGVVDMRTKDEISSHRLPKVRLLEKNVLSEMSTSGFTSPREVYLYLDSVITDSALHQYFVRANLPEPPPPQLYPQRGREPPSLRIRLPDPYRRQGHNTPGPDDYRQGCNHNVAGLYQPADLRAHAHPAQHQPEPEQVAHVPRPGPLCRAAAGYHDALFLLLRARCLQQSAQADFYVQPRHVVLPRRRGPQLFCGPGRLYRPDDDCAHTRAGVFRRPYRALRHRGSHTYMRRCHGVRPRVYLPAVLRRHRRRVLAARAQPPLSTAAHVGHCGPGLLRLVCRPRPADERLLRRLHMAHGGIPRGQCGPHFDGIHPDVRRRTDSSALYPW